MSEPRNSAAALVIAPARAWTINVVQTANAAFAKTGEWAVETAQQFATVVGVLMGPAVLSGYAFACWSLAANLGWTDTFPYTAGALSNSFVWAGLAILLHLATVVLRRHTQPDKK